MALAATPSPVTRRILDQCPDCRSEHLYTVSDGEYTNFLCRACNKCWHAELGWARRVDPSTCPGCEWRGTCLSRFDIRAAS
jgi:hypothetical protein